MVMENAANKLFILKKKTTDSSHHVSIDIKPHMLFPRTNLIKVETAVTIINCNHK